MTYALHKMCMELPGTKNVNMRKAAANKFQTEVTKDCKYDLGTSMSEQLTIMINTGTAPFLDKAEDEAEATEPDVKRARA